MASFYARNVLAQGYRSAIRFKGAVVPGLVQTEYATSSYQLFDSPAGSLNPPTVAIASPAADAQLQAGVAIALRADAADPDGNVTAVTFFADGVPIGEDRIAPFCLV